MELAGRARTRSSRKYFLESFALPASAGARAASGFEVEAANHRRGWSMATRSLRVRGRAGPPVATPHSTRKRGCFILTQSIFSMSPFPLSPSFAGLHGRTRTRANAASGATHPRRPIPGSPPTPILSLSINSWSPKSSIAPREDIVPSLSARPPTRLTLRKLPPWPRAAPTPLSTKCCCGCRASHRIRLGRCTSRGEHANLQYRINDVLLPEGNQRLFGQELDTRFVDTMSVLTGSLPAQYGYRTSGQSSTSTPSTAPSLRPTRVSVLRWQPRHFSGRASEAGGTDGDFTHYFNASLRLERTRDREPDGQSQRDPRSHAASNKGLWLSVAGPRQNQSAQRHPERIGPRASRFPIIPGRIRVSISRGRAHLRFGQIERQTSARTTPTQVVAYQKSTGDCHQRAGSRPSPATARFISPRMSPAT